jgi:hypothetical protein
MQLRTPDPSEIPELAGLWRDAWFDAHEALFPRELIELRTFESFEERLRKKAADIRVAGLREVLLAAGAHLRQRGRTSSGAARLSAGGMRNGLLPMAVLLL